LRRSFGNICEILANILRQNTYIALKLAVFAFAMYLAVLGLIVLIALYAFA
jgi:hypothetical protein